MSIFNQQRYLYFSALSTVALFAFLTFCVTITDAAPQQGTLSSPLVESSSGVFFATIPANGAFGHGSIYRITSAGSFTLMYNFGSGGSATNGYNPQNLMLGPDGNFYGITSSGGDPTLSCGTVFEYTGTLSTLHRFGSGEGCHPSGGLFFEFGQGGLRTLYGTTGIIGGHGTIYTLDFFGTLTTLHTFGASGDGEAPNSPLVVIDPTTGDLIGSTLQGGASGYGTLYEVQFHPLSGPTEAVVFSFSGSTHLMNQTPIGPLASGRDVVYGNIPGFGPSTNGSLYSFTFSNLFSTLASIVPGTNQSGACSGTSVGSDGNVYGATCSAGTNGFGYVYKDNPTTRSFSVIHSFAAAEGKQGIVPPTLGSDGNLYGTTFQGGQFGYGTIYKMSPSGIVTVLHSFTASD